MGTICSSPIETLPVVQLKIAFLFSLFSLFLAFQSCFFCLFLCSFSGFRAATSFETVTTKWQEQKQVEFCLDWFWILNFPCKYVVSGCFPFLVFFLICSFSILKTESEHRANGRNWLERKDGKQKAELPG